MKKLPLSLVVLILTLGPIIAAPPTIGTVTASGAFRLNGDTVLSNGTLTEGALVETGRSNSSVRLAGGARLSLGADSRGRVFQNRIVLEKGEARLENGAGIHLEALGLTIRPEHGRSSTGRIALLGSERVRVAALTGSFHVLSARGVLVANVAAGSALAFDPQQNANSPTRLTGVLETKDGHYLLTDQVSHVTVELTGQGLAALVGKVIQVTGTLNTAATPAAGASQVIAVTSVATPAAGAGGGAAGGGAAAAGAGGAASGAAIGATTVAIVGGVAVAATLGGLAAADALPGQGGATPESR